MQALLFYLIFVKSQGLFVANSHFFAKSASPAPISSASFLFFPLHSSVFVLYYLPTGFHTLSKRR